MKLEADKTLHSLDLDSFPSGLVEIRKDATLPSCPLCLPRLVFVCDGLLGGSVVGFGGLEGVLNCFVKNPVNCDGAWIEIAEKCVFAVELLDQFASPVW